MPLPVHVTDSATLRADVSGGYLPTIQLGNGHDATGRATGEEFFGLVQIGSLDRYLLYGQPQICCDFNDGLTRDALQDAVLRCAQTSIFVHEDIEARPFGNVARTVHENRGFAALIISIEQTDGEVQPVIVLDHGVD